MKYTFWLRIAAIFQVLTAIAHSMSFIRKPVAANVTEKQLLDLMNSYKMDMGTGYHRSMADITTALSACFALLYLFGGLINWYLVSKKVEASVIKGIVWINLILFGVSFGVMFYFTFLPPIVLTGIVFLLFIITFVSMPKSSTALQSSA